MLRKIMFVAGVFGSMTLITAVGCSSSSNGASGGGDSGTSGDSGKGKDGGLKSGDGGGTDDGGKIVGGGDGGGVKHPDGGGGDGGPISLDDGGTVSAPACYDFGAAYIGFNQATAAVAGQGLCNAGQISSYLTACIGSGATTTTCNDYVTANGPCVRCLVGPTDAADTSPFPFPVVVPIDAANDVEVDVTACYAALSTGTAACKTNAPSEQMCVDSACTTCTTDLGSCEDYGYADETGCAGSDPVDSTCVDAINTASADATNQTKCGNSATTFNDLLTAVATTICGAP